MNDAAATVRDNLAGAWALMNGRPEGIGLLDLSIGGFWRSFAAVVLILPFAVLALIGERSLLAAGGETVPELTGAVLLWRGLAVLGDWIAFPLVFGLLARPLGLSGNYVPFIIARNWGSVIAVASAGLVHALLVLGVVPQAAVPFLLVIVLGLALRFAYCIARLTLGVPMSLAIPVVVLDLVVSLVVEAAFSPA